MSALEKEDSVLEFMSESGLAVAFDCKYKCFILSQRLVSARITFFYVQYPAISKILAILTKNDNSSRSDGRWNTSKSSIVGGIGVSFSSDSDGRKGIVGTSFPQMPSLFRIRRNDFERIKVTQYFLLLLFCMCNVFMAPYRHVCSVGSLRYGSIVCSTSTNSNKSFLVLVMVEFFTSLFSWEGGNFSFSIGVFNGINCFSNQIKLNAMACFNVSFHYIPPAFCLLK